MANTSNQLIVPYCSSSSSPPSCWDVFLSFYGKDTRINFTSHLYSALDQAGFLTFRDDPALGKGQEISSGLLDAIRNSNMFIVVLSKNYACSQWCLNELVQILSCKTTQIQVVPVFYYVHPSDVRNQRGNFGEALDGHRKSCSVDVIEKWKSALYEIGALSGYHLRKEANVNESDIIQEIVRNVATQASATGSPLEKYLFGVDYAVEEIYQKLSMETHDVRVFGICGIGGIGKTTIAKSFYNKYFNRFDIRCFNENVEQDSQGGGSPTLSLLDQLLIDLLRKKSFKVIDVDSRMRKLKQILHSKKALIVLDDLEHSNYSDLLSNLGDFFSAGSRIIITTRDANLLNKLKVCISEVDTYMVRTLEENDSLKLFSYHAFGRPVPPENFSQLSLDFVTYAGGLPLALKVLGSSLIGRAYEFWKAKLEKVQEISENAIEKILKLSFDELEDEKDRSIFLDIAFFFVGKDRDEAVYVFKSCDFHPGVGITNLMDRCLLTIDEFNKIQMHSLIQDMGRKVGKSTRLFLQGNSWKNLRNLEEGNNIEGLVLDLTTSTDGQVTTSLFKRMPNLRLLQIINVPSIKGNFKNVFPKLRCIRWHSCPWRHIPSTFRPERLVSIDMPSSKFKTLGKGPTLIKQLNNLSCLYLSKCRDLKRLPEQLGEMKGLKMIDVSLTAIEKLPDSITHLKKLVELNLSACTNLFNLPEQIGNMESLRIFSAGETAIEQLPDSFVGLINLETLNLGWCKNLRNLPDNIWKLKLLKFLRLTRCSKLERLPEQLGEMQCLEILVAVGSAIEEVPDSIRLLSRLRMLDLRGSKKLKYLPESIWNLTSIRSLYLESGDIGIISLPDSIEKLNKLTTLDLSCDVGLCLPMILRFPSLEYLTLTDEGQILSPSQPVSFSELLNLRYLTLKKCTSLGSCLPELPLNLERLCLDDHSSIEQLPDLSSLKLQKGLYIRNCTSLQSISLLPPHLQSLSVKDCPSFQNLPDLSVLKELAGLCFTRCNNLKPISLNQSFLQVGQPRLPFKAYLPNREVAEWFDYKSEGHTVSFDIPPRFGPNILGLALWVVYTCKATHEYRTNIRAVISNTTENMTEIYKIYVYTVAGEAQSSVECITGEKMPMRSGDRIKVSFRSLMYSDFIDEETPIEEVKVQMCGVHVMQDVSSSVY